MSDRTTKHCDVCGVVIEPTAPYVKLVSCRVPVSVTLDVCDAECLRRVSFAALTDERLKVVTRS